MDAPTDHTLGRMIRGYQLEKILGTGKLTTLYHACTEELWLPPEVTIMLLHIPTTLSKQAWIQFTERFTREARRLIKLSHPSLHSLFGYGREDAQFYLIFPSPAPATTLARHLQKQRCWSPSEAFALLAPLSSSFDYIHHQGLVYQFFTPANILLQENAAPQITGTGLLQLLRLQGLDTDVDRSEPEGHLKNIASDYMSMSTYLAPEVVRGEPANTRSDIYSLGIILFELLSGRPPFTGTTYMDIAWKHIREPLPSLHTLAPTIPIALELVINRALHRNPDHRFATAGELSTAFSHVLNERLRSPAYFFDTREIAQKPTSTLLKPINGQSPLLPLPDLTPLPQEEIWSGKEHTTSSMTSHTSTELPIVFTRGEGDVFLDTGIQPSVKRSTPDDIDKMAQHIQQLRENIQGGYQK